MPCSGPLGFSCPPSWLLPAAPSPPALRLAELSKAFRTKVPQARLLEPAPQPWNKGSSRAGSPLATRPVASLPLAAPRVLPACSAVQLQEARSTPCSLCGPAEACSASLLLVPTGPAAHWPRLPWKNCCQRQGPGPLAKGAPSPSLAFPSPTGARVPQGPGSLLFPWGRMHSDPSLSPSLAK